MRKRVMQTLKRDVKMFLTIQAVMLSAEWLLLGHMMAWALQLIIIHSPKEPVSNALFQAGHCLLPPLTYGLCLLAMGHVHLFAIRRSWRQVRVYCLFGQVLFFLFAWYSLLLTRIPYPTVFYLPVSIAFCIGNLLNHSVWRIGDADTGRTGSAIRASDGTTDSPGDAVRDPEGL